MKNKDKPIAVALLRKAIATYYDGKRGKRMAGYTALKDHNLLEVPDTLARITLANLWSGAPAGSATMLVGDAVVDALLPNDGVGFTARMNIGAYLLSMAMYAGLFKMVRGSGDDANDGHSFNADGVAIHTQSEPYFIVEVGDKHTRSTRPRYVSHEPFPPWDAPVDKEGRRLVRSPHLDLRPEFMAKDEWVKGVHAIEGVGYVVNPTMLAIAQKYGSQKPRKKARETDEMVLTEAAILGPEPFYSRVHLCTRGRIYLSRAPVNFQQGDLSRGLLDFATPHKLTEDGMRGLLLHLANTEGVKGDMDDRIRQAEGRLETYRAIGQDPDKHYRTWRKASDPYQFLRACIEVATVKVGDPSHIICEIDQAQSGLAWQAIFTGDKDLAAMTNLLGGYRDLYQEIGNSIPLKAVVNGKEIEATAGSPHDPASPQERRQLAKKAILPFTYGAGVNAIAIQLASWARSNKRKARYTNSLGTETERDARNDLRASEGITDVAKRITKAIHKVAPATKAYSDTLKQFYRQRMVVVTADAYERQCHADAQRALDKDTTGELTLQGLLDSKPDIPKNLRDHLDWVTATDGPDAALATENDWLDGHPVGDRQLQWMMPTGFQVVIRKQKSVGQRVRVYDYDEPWDASTAHSHKLKLWEPTDEPDFAGMITSALADHVHSWDGALVAHVTANADFPIVPVHDAFGVHANNVFKVQRKLMEGLRHLARHAPLSGLFHQDTAVGVFEVNGKTFRAEPTHYAKPVYRDTDTPGMQDVEYGLALSEDDVDLIDVTATNAFS